MSEPKDKARWDICERCVKEVWPYDIRASALEFIKQNRHKRWCNTYYTLSNFSASLRKESCLNCPDKLEHTVLSQENATDG